MDKSPRNPDEARLLPRLRGRSPLMEKRRLNREQAAVFRRALAETLEENPDARLAPRSSEDDRKRLRAIPVISPDNGGGAIPGTRPDQSSWCAVCGKRCKCEAA